MKCSYQVDGVHSRLSCYLMILHLSYCSCHWILRKHSFKMKCSYQVGLFRNMNLLMMNLRVLLQGSCSSEMKCSCQVGFFRSMKHLMKSLRALLLGSCSFEMKCSCLVGLFRNKRLLLSCCLR